MVMQPLAGKIVIFGGSGLVGSAVYRHLLQQGVPNKDIFAFTSEDVDLTDDQEVKSLVKALVGADIRYVYNCAAYVGGIVSNSTRGYDFITKNLEIQNGVLQFVNRWLSFAPTQFKYTFLGSSCVYPVDTNYQPIREDALLSGYLEQTNEPYAIAKIAGMVQARELFKQYNMLDSLVTVMPCNVYGIHDNFTSGGHVIPEMIRKFRSSDKDTVELFGTGTPYREFIYSDDLAEAIVLLSRWSGPYLGHVNVGTPYETRISDLAELIKLKTGNKKSIVWNQNKPDGIFRKKLDTSLMQKTYPDWKPKTDLNTGLDKTIKWYDEHHYKT